MQDIGRDILRAAQSELYMNLPYLDTALGALRAQPGADKTLYAATDGECLYYSGSYLADCFMRRKNLVNHMVLHMVLHCMLRHLAKKKGRTGPLWDLACDVAVESIVDSLDYRCLSAPSAAMLRQKIYGEMRAQMPVLTAEGIYRQLMRQKLSPYELARLQKEFFADDHGLWDMDGGEEKSREQDQKWQDYSSRTQTSMDTVLAGQATGGDAIYEQVSVAARDDVDYRAFLRRFAVHREVMAVDDDAFDYGFYAYGLRRYGKMPLVEPTETREERRIEDFVIAIDTSMSTSGEQVRQFLSSTYSILRSTETFARRVNIRILQCDDQLRRDDVIQNLGELRAYMESFQLAGGSATDFRPVFDHVARLQAEGAFTQLRGLLYFTDGMGFYPARRPPYDAAFVMLRRPPLSVAVPPWAIQLVLNEETLEKTAREWEDSDEHLTEMPSL